MIDFLVNVTLISLLMYKIKGPIKKIFPFVAKLSFDDIHI